jgi:hypothetical protein
MTKAKDVTLNGSNKRNTLNEHNAKSEDNKSRSSLLGKSKQ